MLRSETAAEPERMKRALEGLRRYQEAERPPPTPPMPAVAEAFGATLRDYGGSGEPVVFVPSLINPPNVLDLSPKRSLLRWLAERGHHVLLVDWGWDVDARRDLSVADHVEQILLPFLRTAGPAHLVGYCLGGTMAAAAAQLAAAKSLSLIAAPWHFTRFPDEALTLLAKLWRGSRDLSERLGMLPMETLQTAFWSLDPARTVSKFERFADLPPESHEASSFIALEDWSNDGPPLPYSSAVELFDALFRDDRSGAGNWQVGGTTIDPARLSCPLLNIVSTTDRIVPEASAAAAGERLALAQGHVGMIVGGRAREALWEPLHAWLSRHSAT